MMGFLPPGRLSRMRFRPALVMLIAVLLTVACDGLESPPESDGETVIMPVEDDAGTIMVKRFRPMPPSGSDSTFTSYESPT